MLRETVKGIVRLSFLAKETTESIGGETVGGTTLSINISNVDLNGSVILGSDETVGGRATLRKFIVNVVNSSSILSIVFAFTTCGGCKDR